LCAGARSRALSSASQRRSTPENTPTYASKRQSTLFLTLKKLCKVSVGRQWKEMDSRA
jgi:hypothetical protein